MLRLVLPDVHFPFQDAPLLDAWLEHMVALKPDGIDIIGDIIDCYPCSRFDKNPERKENLQDELDQAIQFLHRLVILAPRKCDIRFSEGNHEGRLRRLLWSTAPALAHLRNLNIPSLLHLKDLGIKYYPPEVPYQIKDVWYLHGDLARKSNWAMTAGGMGAKAVVGRVGGNVIMGHTHQMGHICFRSWEGLREGYEVGCLCRMNLDYIVGVPQWQQGWAVVHFPKGGGHQVELIRVLDQGTKRIIIAGGKVIKTLKKGVRHI